MIVAFNFNNLLHLRGASQICLASELQATKIAELPFETHNS